MTLTVHTDYDCQSLSTFRLQSKAATFAQAKTLRHVKDAIQYAEERSVRVIPIGTGSNIVLPKRLDALLLQIATQGVEVIQEDAKGVIVRVQAGENWHELVLRCAEQGWYGLENLAYIPGTVGAAPIQNIGAYGVEVAQFVKSVSGLHLRNGVEFSLHHSECQFGYRDSIFKRALKDKVVITEVELSLQKQFSPRLDYPALASHLVQEHRKKSGISEGSLTAEQRKAALHSIQPDIDSKALIQAVVAVRRSKLPDPNVVANVGSFFKNPIVSSKDKASLLARFPDMPFYTFENDYKLPAAWLIESCELKGYEEGGLAMSPGHALVMLHTTAGDSQACSADDVRAFANKIVVSVERKFGLLLEPEPRFL